MVFDLFISPCEIIYSKANYEKGAMENWGLVTYRETALLIDERNSSLPAKEYVAIVVGHELAHMWFGNLVTMVNTMFFFWFECVYCL